MIHALVEVAKNLRNAMEKAYRNHIIFFSMHYIVGLLLHSIEYSAHTCSFYFSHGFSVRDHSVY